MTIMDDWGYDEDVFVDDPFSDIEACVGPIPADLEIDHQYYMSLLGLGLTFTEQAQMVLADAREAQYEHLALPKQCGIHKPQPV